MSFFVGVGCGGRFVSLRARTKSDKTGGGGARGVKRVIHQNKINKRESLPFAESAGKKKMFAANLPVVTVNIPEPGWSLDLPLSATAVTTPVGCRFAAGHTVFTWK